MALKITDACVNCDVCEPVCPNQAITMGPEYYLIAPQRCTECVGHHDEPQCVAVCPVDCIVPDTLHAESRAELEARFRALTAAEEPAP